MRPHGSAKTLEQRRLRAVALLEAGLTMEEVSHRVGTSIASVSRWHQAVVEGGLAALAAKPVPGRPRKLSQAECLRFRNDDRYMEAIYHNCAGLPLPPESF